MSKLRRLLSIILLILIFFPVSVSAHPGKTDGSGGHTDSDTDEYHYHHGYPAHDHYDVDGDGDIDCPYDFDNRTGYKSGGNSGSNYTASNTACKQEVISMPPWVYIILIGQLLIIIWLGLLNHWKKEEISELNTQHQKEITSLQTACSREIRARLSAVEKLELLQSQIDGKEKLNDYVVLLRSEAEDLESELTSLRQEKYTLRSQVLEEKKNLNNLKVQRSDLRTVPSNSLADDGMPIYWKYNPSKPYGDYTVYVNSKTGIYHIDRFCSSYHSSQAHIFNVINSHRPCQRCTKDFFAFMTDSSYCVQDESQ